MQIANSTKYVDYNHKRYIFIWLNAEAIKVKELTKYAYLKTFLVTIDKLFKVQFDLLPMLN